jgi:hypothetical protein
MVVVCLLHVSACVWPWSHLRGACDLVRCWAAYSLLHVIAVLVKGMCKGGREGEVGPSFPIHPLHLLMPSPYPPTPRFLLSVHGLCSRRRRRCSGRRMSGSRRRLTS